MSRAAKKEKVQRKFIQARRRNACPACLDRSERYEHQPRFPMALDIVGQKLYEGSKWGPCGMCEDRGFVWEEFPVGNEWRRYPWVIAE